MYSKMFRIDLILKSTRNSLYPVRNIVAGGHVANQKISRCIHNIATETTNGFRFLLQQKLFRRPLLWQTLRHSHNSPKHEQFTMWNHFLPYCLYNFIMP